MDGLEESAMKKIVILLILITLCDCVMSDIRPEYSGSWFNQNQSGHGFSIEVISPERSLVYWYTYDPFGGPIFIYGEGTNVGNRIEVTAHYYQGMVFGEFDPDTNQHWDWGTMTVTFHDCNRATLQYNSILEFQSGEAFGSGQISLVRLASIDGFRCSDLPVAGVYGGFSYSYWDQTTYHGYGIVNEQGELTFVGDGQVVIGQANAVNSSKGRISANGIYINFFNGNVLSAGNFTGDGYFDLDMIGAGYRSTSTGERGFLQVFKLTHLTGRSISLSDIRGSWTAYSYISDQSTPVTINSNGSFSVIDQYGCTFEGRLSIPNAELNIIDVHATVTGCDLASGTFTGNGTYIENAVVEFDGQDVILMAGWNGVDDAAVLRLTRN